MRVLFAVRGRVTLGGELEPETQRAGVAPRHEAPEGHALDARKLADAPGHFLMEVHLRRVTDAERRGREIDRQHLPQVVAGVLRLQRDEGDEEHAGPGEQHERERNLGRREQAQAAVRPRRDADAAARQTQPCRRARRRQAGDVGERHGRRHRQAGADPEQAGVDGDLERAHREARGVTGEHRDERVRQQHAQDGARAAEHQALGEQRPPQRAGGGAERGAHRQFPLAAHRARQDQVGDVRAGNDEHDGGGRQQHQQNRPCRRRDLIAERRDGQAHVGSCRVGVGVLAQHAGVYRGQLGARRFERGPGRQAPEKLRHAVRAPGDHRRPEVMRARHHVRDDLGGGRIRHGRLEHADHGGGPRTEANRLADHGRVAVERDGPEAMREDRRAGRVGAVVACVQQATEHGAKAHHVEERAADHARLHDARLAEAEHREVDRREISEGGDGRDA